MLNYATRKLDGKSEKKRKQKCEKTDSFYSTLIKLYIDKDIT